MRKLSLLAAALMVLSIASYAGAQCCGTANVTSACKALDPNNPTAGVGANNAVLRGCVDDGMGDCAGGAIVDASDATPELAGGCLCVAGNCIRDDASGIPAQDNGADACAAAASAECAETDGDPAPTPPSLP